MQKNLGGDRLGSGNKMNVDLKTYNRSTKDLSHIVRTTMSAGTLVPFLCEVALPGDTWDINLETIIKTHPTIGPLFGSMKIQLDLFLCPIRLYQAQLHNNKLYIGRNMSAIKLPVMKMDSSTTGAILGADNDNLQMNPSCLLKYLGLSGIGTAATPTEREFNALALLMYWDIYKNYYANKQEEIGAVIHQEQPAITETIDQIEANGVIVLEAPLELAITLNNAANLFEVSYTGTPPIPEQIIFNTSIGLLNLRQITTTINDTGTQLQGYYNLPAYGAITLLSWRYITTQELPVNAPKVTTFPLDNLDEMREKILAAIMTPTAFDVNAANLEPYKWVLGKSNGQNNRMNTQEGLAIKTYQSDMFNNWLNTAWIDAINTGTAIDTSGGSFTINALNLANKLYDLDNRIAVSDGSYDSWMDVTYTNNRFHKTETPMYMGGLIKELIFQEVVSNSTADGTSQGEQPLGTLAGKGVMGKKHKGGHATIKPDELSYIIGLISITPRIDYSQGNNWDLHLKTMDDFHKSALDQIGFQDLIQEQMAWWTTVNIAGDWVQKSAGKQPAWLNYMTKVNKTYGNFAIQNNEMFMTLNRRYEGEDTDILDLTTYIDPVKYNQIFANTSIDAQNYWAQIGLDIECRRLMSHKIMPSL